MSRRVKQLVGLVTRGRYLLLLVASLVVGLANYQLRRNDFLFFEYVARVAIGHDRAHAGLASLLHLYVDIPRLQVGPPGLVLAVPFQFLKPSVANEAVALFLMICLVPCIYLIERTARLAGAPAKRTAPLALVAGLAMLPVWDQLAVRFMHMDDVVVLLLLLAATGEVLKGRWLLASIAVSTATVTKPWAVAVVPILFALPRPMWWKAGLAWIVTFVLWWAPFLLAEPNTFVELSRGTNPIMPGSTWALFGLRGTPDCVGGCIDVAYSWMRPLQFGLSILLAAAAVRRGRWLAAPLLGLLGRVTLDVQVWTYYGAGPVLMAVLCDAVAGRWIPLTALVVAVAEYSAYVVDDPTAQAVIRLVIAGLVIAWYLRPTRRQEADGAGADGTPVAQAADVAV